MDDHPLPCSVEELGTTEQPISLSFGRVIWDTIRPFSVTATISCWLQRVYYLEYYHCTALAIFSLAFTN